MIIAGIIAFITLELCKLTAWQPVEGGVYEYGRQLVSPYAGFLAGWMWMVANTFTGAAVSFGFAYYLTAAFPGLPSNMVAAVMCLAFTCFKFGWRKRISKRKQRFSRHQTWRFWRFLWFSAFFMLMLAILFRLCLFPAGSCTAHFSFSLLTAALQECRWLLKKSRMPNVTCRVRCCCRLGISMVVYVLVGLVAVGLLGAAGLAGSASPLATAIGVTGNSLAVQLLSVGGLVATASVLLTAILGVSRMAYSMARRNDLPSALARLHSRFLTPYYAIVGNRSFDGGFGVVCGFDQGCGD